MKNDNRKKNRLIGKFSLLLIFLILSGFMAIVSADAIEPCPNMFFGDVFINGEVASDGTLIEAYIDGELHSGSIEGVDYDVENGMYFIHVTGDALDDGKPIAFKVNGITADHNPVTWIASEIPIESRELDLSVERECGDVDMHCGLDLRDAAHLARFIAEIPGYKVLYGNGDVDGKVGLDLRDAAHLARYLAEIPGYDSLNCN